MVEDGLHHGFQHSLPHWANKGCSASSVVRVQALHKILGAFRVVTTIIREALLNGIFKKELQ